MRQVSQSLPNVGNLQALIAALAPIIEEHGFVLNSIIADNVAYNAVNISTTRTLNASTATATDVANVLGTLLSDLKAKGILA